MTLLLILFLLVASVAILSILIQKPSFQTYVVQKVAAYLSEKADTKITVGSVEIKFFNRVRLNEFYVETQQGDTLLYAKNLDTHIGFLSLRKRQIFVDDIYLEGVRFKGQRKKGSQAYNFTFLEKLFQSKKPKKNKEPVEFNIKKVHLKDINLTMHDYEGGFLSDLMFDKLTVDIEKMDFKQKQIVLKDILFDKPSGKIVLLEKEKNAIDTATAVKKPFAISTGWNISFNDFKLNQGNIFFEDKNISQKPNKLPFDPKLLYVQDINLHMKDTRYDSLISTNIATLNLHIGEKLNLKNFEGNFTFTDKLLEAKDLHLAFNNSVLKSYVSAEYDAISDFKSFANNVYVNGKIETLKVKKEDILLFAPKARPYLTDVSLKGDIRGTFGNIKTENLKVYAGNATVLEGSASIKGLPTIKQMLLDVKVDNLSTTSNELKRLLSFTKLPKEIDKLGKIKFKGSFFGFINDFVANGTLSTDIGILKTDIKIGFGKDPKNASYSGNVQAYNIDIGKIVKTDKIGTLTCNLNLNGKGFTLDNIASNIQGNIDHIDLNHYRFNDIKVDGNLNKKLFDGKLLIDDECLYLDFLGKVDFNNPKNPIYNFQAELINADLQALNLSKNKMIISLDGKFNLQGLKVEDLVGDLSLNDLFIQNDKGSYAIPAISANLAKDGEIRDYQLFSRDFNGRITGAFNPIIMPMQVYKYVASYSSYIDLKPPKDTLRTIPQQFDAHFNLASDLGFIPMFVPKFETFSGLALDLDFDNSKDIFSLTAAADSIVYDKIVVKGIIMDGNTNHQKFNLNLGIDSLLAGKTTISQINSNVESSEQTLVGHVKIMPDTSLNQIDLSAKIDVIKNGVQLEILPSVLKINGKDWTFIPNNKLTIKDSLFVAENLGLVQGVQSIEVLNGANTLSDATVNFNNISLPDIGQLAGIGKILTKGTLSGSANLKDVLTDLKVDASIRIDTIEAAGFGVEQFTLDALYKDKTKMVDLKGAIRDDDYVIDLKGTYDIDTTIYEQANIDLDIKKLNLNFLEPILKYEITNMDAFCQAKCKFSGSYLKPVLDGRAQLIDTAWVKINFLGTTFGLKSTDDIILSQNEIFVQSAEIFDPLGNRGTASGKLQHAYFTKGWALDNMIIETQKMLMLKTTYKDNQDYFGTAFIDGQVIFNGPTDLINIDITGKTLPGTDIGLPVAKVGDDKTYDFIQFVSKDESFQLKKPTYKAKIKGVNLKMELEATPDATVRLIFNPATNDFILARGSGTLALNVYSTGKIEMFGTYTILEGNYLFNFQNVLSKNFKVKPGSTVTFSNDIMKAELNIDALYEVRASLSDILTDSTSKLKNIKVPIDLVLQLRGTLDNTDVSFDIRTKDNQAANNEELQVLLNQIKEDKNQLNTQAFGLLVFQKFLPQDAGVFGNTASSGTSLLKGTVTELLSQQISSFLTDAISTFIEGVDINVNYKAYDEASTNVVNSRELAVAFSTSFLNDRLKIQIGGNFEFENPNQANQDKGNTGIAGDFTISYDITEDGRIRIKAFHKTQDYDVFNEERSKTGIGLSFHKDFDKMNELFKTEKRKKKKKEEQAPQPLVPTTQPKVEPKEEDVLQ
ncbi:MAG: translocation/assembly module TamB domain-containing protein [Chitinophagales bacterium]|nr:translocation/assembly module TamB domain-containing protein [Chitinophagales bacterium]